MQYEIDTTTSKGKTTNFKTKALNLITNTFYVEIFFLENGSKILFLGKLRS